MFKTRSYVLIGVLVYFAVMVASVPANFVLKRLEAPLREGGVLLSNISGTIWNGAGTLKVVVPQAGDFPPMLLNWHFNVWRLILAQVSVDYLVEGAGFKLHGGSRISPRTLALSETSGELSSSLINRFSQEQGVEMSGSVKLTDLSLGVNLRDKSFQFAEGDLGWGGGEITYQEGHYSEKINFPAVKGKMSHAEGTLVLNITDASQGKAIVKVEVAPTGWAKVAVMKRVLELAGKMDVGSEGDKSIVEVQQKIF